MQKWLTFKIVFLGGNRHQKIVEFFSSLGGSVISVFGRHIEKKIRSKESAEKQKEK